MSKKAKKHGRTQTRTDTHGQKPKRDASATLKTIRSGDASATLVKGWGFKYETMAECEAGEGLGFELQSSFRPSSLRSDATGGKAGKLLAAWQRGQLLRKLAAFGAGNASITEAGHELGYEPGGLEALFAKDSEASDTFNNARIATMARLRKVIIEKAEAGNVTPTAMNMLLAMMRKEVAKKSVDYHHIPLMDMVELTRVSRQTIASWVRDFGLSKNADETYDLFKFIAWFEQFIKDKITKEPGKFFKKGTDLEKLKVDKLQMELEENKGLLKPVNEVINGFIARAQGVIQYAERKTAEFPVTLANQSQEEIIKAMNAFMDGFRTNMLRIPEVLDLPPAAAEKLTEVFSLLGLKLEGNHDAV